MAGSGEAIAIGGGHAEEHEDGRGERGAAGAEHAERHADARLPPPP